MFQWSTVTGADAYKLRYYVLSTGAMTELDIAGGTTTSFTPTVDLPSGKLYWMILACRSGRCGSAPSTIPTYARYVTIPGTSTGGGTGTGGGSTTPTTSTLTWSTVLANENAGLTNNATLGVHLAGKKLTDIINSSVSGRGDGKLCNDCHKAANQDAALATLYRPAAETGITPTTWNYKCRTSAIGSAVTHVTCKWNYTRAINAVTLVENFCEWVGRTPANKPQDLCDIFRKWAADGYQP